MDVLHNGWFTEFAPDDFDGHKKPVNANDGDLKPGMMRVKGVQVPRTGECFSLAVSEVLFHEKSKFQDVLVFKR